MSDPARRHYRPIWVWRLFAAVPTVLVVLLLAWAALFLFMAPDLPDTDTLFKDSEQRTVTVLAADDSVIAERGAAGSRFVGLDEIAPDLVDAVIATEDHRFYRHFGIDPIGMARAMLANFRSGEVVAGGSTITQQLAKNLFLTPERSLNRKLQELALAIWIEARLTKNEILTLYMNRVYLGAGAYGVEAAAQRYFGKSAGKLTLAESAMIAGLLKAPSAYAPINHLERARARATIVLGRMVDAGYIGEEEALAARTKPAQPAPENRTDLAGHFVDWVLDELTDHLGKAGRDLVVRTTLDRRLQISSEDSLRALLAKEGARRGVGEGAIVLIESNGAIRAMVGGESYRTNGFNRAIQARRQPGSAFKPFLFAAAFEQGLMPESPIDDKPIATGDWRPENFDGRYRGRVTLSDAFAQSLNTAAARLIQTVGPERVVRTARNLGIGSPLQPVPSLALGTSEVGLLELTSAYLPIATGGVRYQPFAVREVRNDRGELLYSHVTSERRVLEPRVAAMMQHIMVETIERGTGKAARLPDRPAGGKTGTTQSNRDAWFVGFSGGWVAGVWLGNDDNTPMKSVTGGNLPAQLWRDVMAATPKTAPVVVARAPAPARSVPPARSEQRDDGLITILDWIERTFGSSAR